MTCAFNFTETGAKMSATNPLFQGSMICGEELTIAFMRKPTVTLTQLFSVGFSILEISKLIMQTIFYEGIQKKLGVGHVSTIMSDTDSFLFVSDRGNNEQIMDHLSDLMDFSNYPPTSAMYSDLRKRSPGYLKNEMPEVIIVAVTALKAKTYSILSLTPLQYEKFQSLRRKNKDVSACKAFALGVGKSGAKTYNIAKGVKKGVKEKIAFSQFSRCIENIDEYEVDQNLIRSYNHVNKLIRSRKIAFSSFDDKRYLLCSRHSVPYGSHIILKSHWLKECYFCHHEDDLH